MTQAPAAPAALLADPALEAKRRRTVLWVVAIATVGLIFDGYDLVVYGVILPMFTKNPGLIGPVDATTGGLLGSYALFGVLIGALGAGTVGDLIGRRKVMLVSFFWFAAGMFVTSFMTSTSTFGWMRFVTGLGIGAIAGTTGALGRSSPHRGARTSTTRSATRGCRSAACSRRCWRSGWPTPWGGRACSGSAPCRW
ncbi:MAG: MFS transporter [Dermatophilaceae bacterium]